MLEHFRGSSLIIVNETRIS